jgi:hypothetical protein
MRNFVYSSLWDFKLPIREEGVLRIFIALKNPSPWPGFEPATFGFSGQNTNHDLKHGRKSFFLACWKNVH